MNVAFSVPVIDVHRKFGLDLFCPELETEGKPDRWCFIPRYSTGRDDLTLQQGDFDTGITCFWGSDEKPKNSTELKRWFKAIRGIVELARTASPEIAPEHYLTSGLMFLRLERGRPNILGTWKSQAGAGDIRLCSWPGYSFRIAPSAILTFERKGSERWLRLTARRKHSFFAQTETTGAPEILFQDLLIPVDGRDAGTLKFTTFYSEKNFSDFRFGLKFSVPSSGGKVTPLDFPLLRPENKIEMVATLDIATSKERNRCNFKVVSSDAFFTSDLLTTHGVDLYLKPTSSSCFILSAHSNVFDDQTGDPILGAWYNNPNLGSYSGYYEFGIAIEGDFDVYESVANAGRRKSKKKKLHRAAPNATKIPLQQRTNFGFLTGLADREFVRLEAGDQIRFDPTGPSFDKQDASSKEGRLYGYSRGDSVPCQRTSWISVVRQGQHNTVLISESGAFALYDLPQPSNFSKGEAVKGHYVPIRLVPEGDSQAAGYPPNSLPIAPYRSFRDFRAVGNNPILVAAAVEKFDKNTVAPYRRSLFGIPSHGSLVEPKLSFTPLNLLVSRSGDHVTRIVLAKKSDPYGFELAIDSPSNDLKNWLERDQLFMVMTGIKKNHGSFGVDKAISIAGWPFFPKFSSTAELHWAANDPVVIVKGVPGKLDDLIDAHDRWAGRGIVCPKDSQAFGKTQLRQLLEKKGATGVGAAAVNEAYAELERVRQDPNWVGILILNCIVDQSELPAQIQAVRPGIKNKSGFKAHHIGMRLNRINVGDGKLDLADASLFGAINYPPEARLPSKKKELAANSVYDLLVDRIVVGFSNNKINAFFAQVTLTAKQFFDSNATTGDKIVILGSHESRVDANNKAVDIYTFAAEKTVVFKFANNQFIEEIEINRVVLSVVSVDDVENKVTSRISANGSITFGRDFPSNTIRLFDDNNPSNRKFPFRNLGIEFTFSLDDDSDVQFKFKPVGFSVDLSGLRKLFDGFLKQFPFKPKAFEWLGENGLTLGEIGFTHLFGNADPNLKVKYGLTFDLDLGSLGSLASKLKAFQFNLVVGWLGDANAHESVLGMKFTGGGGEGLDIGINNILRVKADQYGVMQLSVDKKYVIYAMGAEIEIFGKRIPNAELSFFIFVDPKEPERVGWFILMQADKGSAGGLVEIDLLGGGQRVDPFVSNDADSVRELIKHAQYLSGLAVPSPGNPNPPRDVQYKKILDELKDGTRIRYDAASQWTALLDTKIVEFIKLQFVARDPSLYGINLDIAELIGPIDVLYRKLSDDLGVYALEFVPPWRRFDVGPVTIIIPAIGIDIYTDGGFRIDLGFPYNHNFSRTFVAEMPPFVGSAGLYYAQTSGAGSRLIPIIKPLPLADNSGYERVYEYNPVVEAGFYGALGLGKSIDGGIFKASARIEIYGSLEGAHGTRRELIKKRVKDHYEPAKNFLALRGTIGIHGNIEGAVDFGITRARAWVDIYVEIVILLRTDDHLPITLNVGVSIGLEWEIARVRVFGKTFRVTIYLEFHTTISYSWTLGKRDDYFGEIYEDKKNFLELSSAFATSRKIPDSERYKPIEWADDFKPSHWGQANEQPLTLAFAPQLVFSDNGVTSKKIKDFAVAKGALEFVPLLWANVNGPKALDYEPPSEFEQLVRALAVWAVWSVFKNEKDPSKPLDWMLTIDEMGWVLDRIAGDQFRYDDYELGGPAYDMVGNFLRSNFNIEIESDMTEFGAALFPMPIDLILKTEFQAGQPNSIELWKERMVDNSYKKLIRSFFADYAIQSGDTGIKKRTPVPHVQAQPVVSLLFEEHVYYLLRGAVAALNTIRTSAKYKGLEEVKLDELVKALLLRGEDGSMRPACAVATSATRFFLHGLRIPNSDTSNPDPVPVFKATGLQLPTDKNTAPLKMVSLIERPVQGGTPLWFKVKKAEADIEALTLESQKNVYALNRNELKFDTVQQQGWRSVANEYAPLSRRRMRLPEGLRSCLTLHPDLVSNADGTPAKRKFLLREAGESKGIACERALLVPIRIKQVFRDGVQQPGVYDIKGAVESDRRLLDLLAQRADVKIKSVGLFAAKLEGEHINYVQVDSKPSAKFATTVIRVNLSVEPKLDAEAASFNFTKRSAEDNSAEISEGREFANLIRFSSVVNSGGFYLYADNDEIDKLFEPVVGTQPEGAAQTPALQMLIRYDYKIDEDVLFPPANSVLFDFRKPIDPNDPGGPVDPNDQRDEPCVIAAGEVARSAFMPGLLRFVVKTKDPNLLYSWPGIRVDEPTYENVRSAVMLREGLRTDAEFQKLLVEQSTGGKSDAYGFLRADMLTRYSMLHFEVDGHPDDGFVMDVNFGANLPISPTKQEKIGGVNIEADELGYIVTVPAGQYLKEKGDPYGAIGKRCRLKYSLRDVFGNSLGMKGESSKEYEVVKYTDAIEPFWAVAGIKMLFEINPKKSAIDLFLEFSLNDTVSTNPAPKLSLRRRQEKLRKILSDIWLSEIQLFPPSESIARDSINIILKSTLLASNFSLLSDADQLPEPGELELKSSNPVALEAICKFLRDIRVKLEETLKPIEDALRQGKDEEAPLKFDPLKAKVSINLPGDRLTKAEFVPLAVSLVVERAESLIESPSGAVSKAFGASDRRRREILIAPNYDHAAGDAPAKNVGGRESTQTSLNEQLGEWAEKLLELFERGGSKIPYWVASGRTPNVGSASETLWLVDSKSFPKADLRDRVFGAPLPFANEPVSFEFATGQKKWSIREGDMEVIARRMAHRLDHAIFPKILKPVLEYAKLENRTAEVRKSIELIQSAKYALADYMGSNIAGVHDNGFEKLESPKLAFTERLRRRLSSYFEIDAILAQPLDKPHRDLELARHLRIEVTPQPITQKKKGKAKSEPPKADYSVDQAPIAIGASDAFTVFIDINPSKKIDGLTSFNAELDLRPSHIQRLRYPTDPNAAMEGRATQWLTFVKTTRSKPKDHATIEVPIIRRALPPSPLLIEQIQRSNKAISNTGTYAQKIAEARRWNLGLAWAWQEDNAGLLELRIVYNSAPVARAELANEPKAAKVREAIARFVAFTDDLWGALESGTSANKIDDFSAIADAARSLEEVITEKTLTAQAVSNIQWDEFEAKLVEKRSKKRLVVQAKTPTGERDMITLDPEKYGELRKDSVTLRNIDVLSLNAALLQIKYTENPTYSERFHYVVKSATAGSALIASIHRDELLYVSSTSKNRKPLKQWIEDAFRHLLKDASNITLDVEGIYQSLMFQKSDSPAFLKHIRKEEAKEPGTPALKFVGLRAGFSNDSLDSELEQISENIALGVGNWLAVNKVPADGGGRIGQLRFRVSMFATTGPAENTPILRIENLLLPLSAVE